MKNNNNLKICFAIAMLFSVCSIKAQSLEQKFQKDMELRKNHVNAMRLKANEQQLQQQAEITTTAIDNKPTTEVKQNQTGNTNTSVQKVQAGPAIKPSSGSMKPAKKSGASRG
jgi:hypothetical protein